MLYCSRLILSLLGLLAVGCANKESSTAPIPDLATESIRDLATRPSRDLATSEPSDLGIPATMFPVKLSPGSRYLVDQNGVPFPILGDSGWEIITTLGIADAKTYLSDRQLKGFNSILLELIDNQFTASPTGANVNGDLPFLSAIGGAPYTNARTQSPDFSTPNPAYWSYTDQVINLVASYGFLILLYPDWIGDPIGDPGSEGYYNALLATSAAVRQGYGKFVANRYASVPNIIWVQGGDNNPADKSVVNDIVAGMKSVDTTHLMTVDTLDGTSPMDYWGDQSWLDVDNVYTDILLNASRPWIYQKSKIEYQRANWKPMFLKEAAYENEHSSASQFLRAQSWQAVLGGCSGYFFGNNPIWLFGKGWQSALASRGSLDSQVLNELLRSHRWDLLVPDWSNAFLTNGGSYANAQFVSAARASDGSWGALYIPGSQPLTIDLSGFSSRMNASWIDPTTGAPKLVSGAPFSNSGSIQLTPMGNNASGTPDWLLVFEPAH
jgi:hypothetical protein